MRSLTVVRNHPTQKTLGGESNMKVRTLVTNAILAALYIAVTLLVAPVSFSHIQFRISEMFNHLVVFDKKYFFGIVVGVLLVNIFSPNGAYEVVFGLSHTVISLGITIFLTRYIKNVWILMSINTIVFSFNMYLIAFMLKLVMDMEEAFLFLWMTTGVSELIVMTIGMFVMYVIHKRIRFDHLMHA